MKRILILLLLVIPVSCEMLSDCPKLVKGKPEKSDYPVAVVIDTDQSVA